MGNAEQKYKSESKGKNEPSLKDSTKGVQTVKRSNLKIHLDISGKAKDTGISKPPVPERTSSLEPEERLRNEIDITLPQSTFAESSRAADQKLDEEYSTRTEELEIKHERKLMVAAVDFGTTYSGYAFSFYHDHISATNPDKIYLSNWVNEGGNHMYAKTPTCLLLDPDGNLDSFGSAAMEKFSSLTDDNEHHDWYFFWQFKMVLHQKEEIHADTIVTEENGKTLEAIKVFQYSILYIKDRLMEKVKKGIGDRIHETDIQWVFTVPAIWNESAKKFMRQAAEQAGIMKDLIEIALEPESASMYCSTVNFCRTEHSGTSLRKFPIGTRYMVLDCGGGTVDVTVYEVLHGNRLRELHAATGGNWGGIQVNKAFCNFVSQLTGPENFQTFSAENKAEYLQLLQDFEAKKYTANPKSTSFVRIKIQPALLNILNANQSNFAKVEGKIKIANDKLAIEAELFRSFFEKPVKDTINHIQELVEIVPGKLDTILLVGGFAESPVLQKAVEDRFNKRFNVIAPLEASTCVLKGAVLYSLNPVSVAYRVSRYTYGVSTSIRYQEGVHPQERKAAGAKEAFCDDIFDVHVKINQQVPTNKAVTERTYYPITNDDKLLHITLYRSSQEDPKFIDEEDCEPVGTMEIKIDTSVGKTSRDRPVKVKMIFGGSDIKVLAQQNNRKPPQEADFKLNGIF